MPVMDHNVVPVYKMGITGRNVTVAVVDDGVEHGHPDLEGNFVSPPKPTSCPFTLSLDLEVQYNCLQPISILFISTEQKNSLPIPFL